MNVLVTGAAGFVGPHLVRALRAAGSAAWGVGLEAAPPAALSGDAAVARWARWDLAAGPDAGREPLPWGADAIVHLAGQASAARSFDDPRGTFEANALGTLALLEAARARGASRAPMLRRQLVRGVRAEPRGTPATEDAPHRAGEPVRREQGGGRGAARSAYARGHGMQVVIARAFSHTGPGQGPSFALASWARQIAELEARAARGEAGPYRLEVGNLDAGAGLLRRARRGARLPASCSRGARPARPTTSRAAGASRCARCSTCCARGHGSRSKSSSPARGCVRPTCRTWWGTRRASRRSAGRPAIPFEETLDALLDGARRETGAPVQGGA